MLPARRVYPRFSPALVLAAAAHGPGDDAADSNGADRNSASAEPMDPAAIATLDPATMMQHIRVLAHDSRPGRAAGSVGEEETGRCLESPFRVPALAPGNTDGAFIRWAVGWRTPHAFRNRGKGTSSAPFGSAT